MNRTRSENAVVLALKSLGENNSSVTLLTQEQGIVYATLYGGPKSKMKSLVAQWNAGVIYLYDNPEKNQIKISDFDVKKYHTSFGQSLYKSFAAFLAAELVIKTKCGGSNSQAFSLVSAFLDGLELVNEDQGKLGLVRFLWRYLELLGIQPDACCCGRCGKSFTDLSFAPDSKSYYNNGDNNFICFDCAISDEQLIAINTEAVKYLGCLSILSPAEVRALKIDRQTYEEIKQLVFFIIQNSIGFKLNTIETGIGIL